MGVIISVEKCVGCGLCIKVCPFDALKMVEKKAVCLDTCTLCGMCVDACKFKAITKPEREAVVKANPDDYRGVWVFVQNDHGAIHHVSLELMGEGRKLADRIGAELCCLAASDNVGAMTDVLKYYDVDRIYAVESPVLKDYRTQPFVDAASALIRRHKPEIVLIGATSTGRDFAGALATTLETGLTADCTGLDIDVATRSLLQTRPAFGGNIMATIKSANHRPQMATVRPKVFPMPLRGEAKPVETVMMNVPLSEDNQKTRVLEWIPIEESVSLADADVIVSGGRGMGKPENLDMLTELAGLLGGALGASRAAVDAGWVEYSHQVGQTGRTVRPQIYIACGISGAVQHLAGMKTSDIIIAVNRDREAPIFNAATYGYVGDALAIVPKVVGELKKRLG